MLSSTPVAAHESPATPSQPSVRGVFARLWPESGSVNSIPSLDGLRAVAVLLVILFHSWAEMPGIPALVPGFQSHQYAITYGRTGVQLFFVLSGFLLFLPYARWIFGLQPRPSARMFYRRRALRVGPAYWASLIILVLAGPLTLAALGDALVHVFFLSNVSAATAQSINAVYWTMAVEVQFYVALPLIAWAASRLVRRFGTRAGMGIAITAMAAISVAADLLDHVHGIQRLPVVGTFLVGQYSLPFHLVVFGIGITCGIFYVNVTQVIRLDARQRERLRLAGNATLVAGIVLLLATAFAPGGQPHFELELLGLGYGGVLFGTLFGPAMVRRALASRPMRFIGLISYSVYLWHSIVIRAIGPLLPAPTHANLVTLVIARFLIGAPLSLAVAYVSFQLTERPFFQARKRAHESASQRVSSAAAPALTTNVTNAASSTPIAPPPALGPRAVWTRAVDLMRTR